MNLLKEGNHRFTSGMAEHPRQDFQRLKDIARRGQQPFAAILACSDARLPLELMFDCGFGDLFCIRTAGNTFSPAVLGAVDFAAGFFKVPLLVVMGHSDCGAINSVVGGGEVPSSIEPALATIRDAARQMTGAPSTDASAAVATANVWLTIERLIKRSAVLTERLQAGQLGIAAAMCNSDNAKVRWLEQRKN